MNAEPVLTTKECAECGYVFLRYIDHGTGDRQFEHKKEQLLCPNCAVPRFVVRVQRPGETL
jgi:rubredoxin